MLPASPVVPDPLLEVERGSPSLLFPGKYQENVELPLPEVNSSLQLHNDDQGFHTPTLPDAPTASFTIYYQNVRGLRTKIDDVHLAMLDAEYDVIVLTETWLNDEIYSVQLFGECYTVYRNDRDSTVTGKERGGGVLIAVASKYNSSRVTTEVSETIEHLWVNVLGSDSSVVIGAVYLAPEVAVNCDAVQKHLDSALNVSAALRPGDIHLLLGDYNQPYLAWVWSPTGFLYPDPSESRFSSASACLVDGMSTLNLKQMSDVKNCRGRSLDLVFINEEAVSQCTVSEAPESLSVMDDPHPPLVTCIPFPQPTSYDNSTDDMEFNFRKADFDAMSQVIDSFDWIQLLDGDIDVAVSTFTTTLTQLFRRFVPPPRPRRKPPWSNRELRELKRQRAAALRRYSNHRNPSAKRQFNIASNNYRTCNRILYSRYVKRKEDDLKRNPKSFWAFMNEKRKTKGLPTSMFLGDECADSREGICNLFAHHFLNVFKNDSITDEGIRQALSYVPRDVIEIGNFSFSEQNVLDALRSLKASTTPGADGVPSIVLKKCAESIVVPLTIIINKSLSLGKFPDMWKESVMFPIHKKGDKRDVSTYRGITSLCAGSKLLEILVGGVLTNAVKSYISPDQHGFFKGRSIDTNLVEFSSHCIKAIENGAQIDTVYTDLKAAFDRVDHRLLVAKLSHLGASSQFTGWIGSYLVNRQLTVKLGSSQSYAFTNCSGVPQGSNLGPILFSIFFNDVCLLIPAGYRLVYADDLKIYIIVRSTEDCRELQRLVNLFEGWCLVNHLAISVQKCYVISFTRKKSPINWMYDVAGIPIERVGVVKDLGVLLDSQLTFRDHYSSTIAKANRNLGFIMRAANNFRDPYCLRALYYALVRSLLETASTVWSPYHYIWQQRIEAVQSRFVRFALRFLPWNNPERLPPYEDRCRLLQMETLQQRRSSARVVFVAKLLLGHIDSPQILRQINLNAPAVLLRSSDFLRLSFRRTEYGMNEPILAMCREFNEVYYLFDFSQSIEALKRCLKRRNLT